MARQQQLEVFDGVAAAAMVGDLRSAFVAGKTRSYEWRVKQLEAMARMMDERESEIVEALRSDLNKPEFESVLYEVILPSLSLVNLHFSLSFLSFCCISMNSRFQIWKMFVFPCQINKFWLSVRIIKILFSPED